MTSVRSCTERHVLARRQEPIERASVQRTCCWLPPPLRCGAVRGASVRRRSECLDRSMPKQQVEGRPTHRHSVPRTPHACFTSHVSPTRVRCMALRRHCPPGSGTGRRPGDVMRDKSGQQTTRPCRPAPHVGQSVKANDDI